MSEYFPDGAPAEQGQATLEGARKPPVEVLVQAANEVTYTFLFGYDSLPDFPSINDGQIRCQAGPSVQKTACGKLYRNDSARDNDTSVQSQPRKTGTRNEGGSERPSEGNNPMTALSHGWSVLPPKDIGCNRNISISDIWFREVVSNRNF